MPPITVLKGNVPTGPFTREQIAEKLRIGEITLNDLAFIDGLSQWTPLREVLTRVDGVASGSAPVPAPAAAPSHAPAPISQPPAGYSYAATMAPPSHLTYAGFWLRVVAYLIDGLIVGAFVSVVGFLLAMIFTVIGGAFGAGMGRDFARSMGNPNAGPDPGMLAVIGVTEFLVWGVALIGSWLYFAIQESGPAQATIGKRVMGLRVTDISGQRISFGRASGRFFGKIVSGMIFYIGFIMAGFTERKRALHDMIAGTLVVKG